MKKYDIFDILVYGPGEKAIREITDYSLGKKELHTIGGIIYKSNGVIKKTTREYPEINEKFSYIYDRDVYLDYNKKLHNVHVESTRGCSNRCNFCFHPSKSGSLQLKPPEIFIDEIEELNRKYGFSYFHLAGSNPPFRHLVNIARELYQRQCNYGFMGFQSLRYINNKEIDWIKRGNFDWFWIGIESGSNILLKKMNKKRSVEDVVERFKILTDNRIFTTVSIIIPSIGESDETVRATIEVLKQINADVLIMYPPIVQPQSLWFDSKEGSIIVEDPEQTMYEFIEHGMEWHPGNKILPMVFRSPFLAEKIIYDGKSYKDTYYMYKHQERMIKKAVYGNNMVTKYNKKRNSDYRLKRAYFKSQIIIANSIHNGNFTRAKKVLKEYNDIVAGGKLC